MCVWNCLKEWDERVYKSGTMSVRGCAFVLTSITTYTQQCSHVFVCLLVSQTPNNPTTTGAPGVPSQGNLLDWADKALGQGISSVTRGVKNLLSGARQAPVAAALEALMDGKQVRRV